jgi:hypothetical protein
MGWVPLWRFSDNLGNRVMVPRRRVMRCVVLCQGESGSDASLDACIRVGVADLNVGAVPTNEGRNRPLIRRSAACLTGQAIPEWDERPRGRAARVQRRGMISLARWRADTRVFGCARDGILLCANEG